MGQERKRQIDRTKQLLMQWDRWKNLPGTPTGYLDKNGRELLVGCEVIVHDFRTFCHYDRDGNIVGIDPPGHNDFNAIVLYNYDRYSRENLAASERRRFRPEWRGWYAAMRGMWYEPFERYNPRSYGKEQASFDDCPRRKRLQFVEIVVYPEGFEPEGFRGGYPDGFHPEKFPPPREIIERLREEDKGLTDFTN